jgi:hypothetical protein
MKSVILLLLLLITICLATIQNGGNWVVGGSLNAAFESGENGVNGISGSILLGHFLWKSWLLEGVPLGGYESNSYGSVTFQGISIGLLYIPKPEAAVPFHVGAVFGSVVHDFNNSEFLYRKNYVAAQVGVWIFMSQKSFFYVDSKIGSTYNFGLSQFLVLPELGFAFMF